MKQSFPSSTDQCMMAEAGIAMQVPVVSPVDFADKDDCRDHDEGDD